MWRKSLSIGLLIILVLNIVPGAHAQEGGRQTLAFDGFERTFTVTLPPSYDGSQPVPLVIALHTFASSGLAMQALTGLDVLAERYGAIIVYPDSVDLGWTHQTEKSGLPSYLTHTDDVGFITALLDEMVATYNVDPAQVHLTAFGSGAWMAYRLACDLPDRLASVAVVGNLPLNYQIEDCVSSDHPPSLLMLLGGEDENYYPRVIDPRTHSEQAQRIALLEADETLAFWAEHNGCNISAVQTDPVDQAYTAYDHCVGGSTVAQYIMPGVGHNWLRIGDYHLNQFQVNTTDIVGRFLFGDYDQWANLFTRPSPRGEVYFGVARSYIVYVPPSYDPAVPTPVVVALHGRPHNGAGFAYLLDFNQVAAENGVIVVYPDGFKEEWNYVREITPGYEDWGVNDVEFLNFLIDDLAQDLNIDRARLYATGFSNGGFMTQRLACEAETPFAAFAVFGATFYPLFEDICGEAPLRPIMLIHGTLDRSVPWQGTAYGDVVVSESVPDTILYWAARNGCDPQAIDYELLPFTQDNAPSAVFRYAFGGCAEGANVVYYVIEGGGHNLPGVPFRLDPEIAGEVNLDMNAGETIWSFFAQYALDSAE
jgi:polyhydroxybutyrate depolymerase